MTHLPLRYVLLGILPLTACRPAPSITLAAAETLAARDAADPTVAVDPRDGTVYVAWAQMRADSTWNLAVTAQRGTAPFGSAVIANPTAGEVVSSGQFPPQVQVGSDGAVHVAWLAQVAGSVQIRIARSDDGGVTFGPPVTLGATERGPVPSLYYDMATGPNHTVYAAWLDLGRYAALEEEQAKHPAMEMPPVDADLRFAISTDDGRSFSAPALLDSNSCICCRASVAGGADGKAYLMWRHVFPVNERDVVVASATHDGAVAAPVRVHADHWKLDGCPDLGPDLGVGANGRVHAAWYTGATGLQGLYYAASADSGRSFGAPVPILVGPSVPGSQVKVAVDRDVPWLVWEEARDSTTRLRLAHVTATDSLAALPEPIGTGAAPAIAAGHGRLGVAWSDHGAIQVRLGQIGSR